MQGIVGIMKALAAGGTPPAGPSRLYLSNAAAGYTPATKRGAWDDASASTAKKLGAKSGAAATVTPTETSTTDLYDVLGGRWISDPLAYNITITGTVEWILGALENASGANAVWHIHIFVTQGDSDSLRGTLLTNNIGATEFPLGSAVGRGEGAQSVSSVNALVGDRIVVEVGAQFKNTSATSATATIDYGNTGSTDLTSGSANVTTEPGWIEFSQGLGLP